MVDVNITITEWLKGFSPLACCFRWLGSLDSNKGPNVLLSCWCIRQGPVGPLGGRVGRDPFLCCWVVEHSFALQSGALLREHINTLRGCPWMSAMRFSSFCESWQSINCAGQEQCRGNKAISATICCEQAGRAAGWEGCLLRSCLLLTSLLCLYVLEISGQSVRLMEKEWVGWR